jgi:hypothetical protein
LDIAELRRIPNCKMFAENNFAGVILETPPSPRNKTIHYFKAGRVSMFNNHSEPQALLEALEKLEEELKNRIGEEIRAWLGEGYPFRLAGDTLKPDSRLGEYPKILANKKLIQKLIIYLYTTKQPCKNLQNQGCETELTRILPREKSYVYYSIPRDNNRRSYPPDTGNQITKMAIAALIKQKQEVPPISRNMTPELFEEITEEELTALLQVEAELEAQKKESTEKNQSISSELPLQEVQKTVTTQPPDTPQSSALYLAAHTPVTLAESKESATLIPELLEKKGETIPSESPLQETQKAEIASL